MLTDAQLEALLGAESDRVECKRSLAELDRVQEAICAFANDMPGHGEAGVVFIGIEDSGKCAGLVVDDPLLRQLAQLRDNGKILPLPSMTVQKRTLRGCDVAVVIVQPSQSLPVRFRGRVWIRVGPRRAIAGPEEERQLLERRRAFDLPFDAREAPSAVMTDLDQAYMREEYLPVAIAPDVLAQNRRTLEHQLMSIRFLGLGGRPTHLGLLVAGIDTRAWMPGAYVQFVRFDGAQLTGSVRDQKAIAGRLSDVLRRVDEVLQANIATAVSFTATTQEIRQSEYPLAALQQLVRNAIMHRSYEGTNAPVRIYWFEDRIEIHNPGGPYGIVNERNFGQPNVSDYRNPHLAEAMKNLGFVQRFGVGIAIARRELELNGNPPVEFDVQPAAVLAVVRRHP